ncbi:MAG: quinone-dependent dihydroorotate dehydrogenase [Rhodospirillales bacterium]|nr:quinone-dependent dihydroorotate dehydrogenase [Rhodospirillales bacterium]
MSGLYSLLWPFINRIDPETAHGLAIAALKRGLVPGCRPAHDPRLQQRVCGLDFANPVGLAAGFDKNAEVAGAMLGQGFGFIEVGTVTPKPQPGNPKPRLFRLARDRAVINRLGFNGGGMEVVLANLPPRSKRAGPVGVNLGKNKTSDDAVADYVAGVRAFAGVADYLVVNVSSPNTPGLRALQNKDLLIQLLDAVLVARGKAAPENPPPLLLKVAPDLTEDDIQDIAAVALEKKLDGLIATNTTIDRPAGLQGHHRDEVGGLSGAPLFAPSTKVLSDFYALTEGRITLIGVGGVSSGAEAYAKIRAGASLVQCYTALVYEGPGVIRRINRELAGLLARDGFANVAGAVGADHKS